jgi:hypothetical protein
VQPGYRERLEHLVDAVIRLESFAGTKLESNPTFKDYNGKIKLAVTLLRPL